MGPKSSEPHLYERAERIKPCEDGGRDWSDVPTSQEILRISVATRKPESWMYIPLEPQEATNSANSDFILLNSKTVRG